MRVLVLVTLLGGCDVVWGLKTFSDAAPPTPDVLIDAAPDSETCVTLDEPAAADVLLISTVGTTRDQGHGTEGLLNVSTGLSDEALIRFLVPSLGSGQHFGGLRFIGPHVAKASECSGSCGSCDSLSHDGTFAVAYATSNWTEATACYNRPATAQMWQIVGATGAMDRSAVVGTASFAHVTELDVDLDVSSIASWIQNGQLSVIVTPMAGGAAILPQVQYATFDPCVVPQAPVKLQFTVCQ